MRRASEHYSNLLSVESESNSRLGEIAALG
jgi:hypothetical protein